MTELNLDAHWMPYTAKRAFVAQPRIIVGAQGRYYKSDDGRDIYDSLFGALVQRSRAQHSGHQSSHYHAVGQIRLRTELSIWSSTKLPSSRANC